MTVKRKRRHSAVAYVASVIVSILCYSNSLNGDFVHDDIPAVLRNRDVLGDTSLLDVFRNDFWGTPMADENSHKSYRPLTVLSFRFTNWLFGMKPYWFHVGNILLHTSCTVLFTRIAVNVVRLETPFATIAGVLFAAHPIHTEAVAGIVGRADILACIFFNLSFLSYNEVKHRTGPNNYRVMLSCFFACLGLLTKETGITVLLVNLLCDTFNSWTHLKRLIFEKYWMKETSYYCKRITKLLITMIALAAFRLTIMKATLPRFSDQDNPAAFHPLPKVRWFTYSYLAAFNFWLILFPFTLSHDWQMSSIPLIISILDYRNLFTIIFFSAVFSTIHKIMADAENHRHMPLLIGTLLSALPFIPASNLLFTVGFVVAERILYLPSMGVILLVIYGGQILLHKNTLSGCKKAFTIYSGFCLLSLIFIGRTIQRNEDWTSRQSLIKSGINSLPRNAKMHYNWANYLREVGDYQSSIHHYQEALRLWPSYASAHNNLGTLMDSASDAEIHFRSAIQYSPNHVNAHFNLGQVYRKMNRTEEAISMLITCLRLNSNYVGAYILIAKLCDGQPAAKLLKHVIDLQEHNPHYFAYYAQWLHKRHRLNEAIYYYKKALQLSPAHRSATMGLIKAYRDRGYVARLQLIQIRLKTRRNPNDRNVLYRIYSGSWFLKSHWEKQKMNGAANTLANINDNKNSVSNSLMLNNVNCNQGTAGNNLIASCSKVSNLTPSLISTDDVLKPAVKESRFSTSQNNRVGVSRLGTG